MLTEENYESPAVKFTRKVWEEGIAQAPKAILFLCSLTFLLSSCSNGFESRWNHVYGKEVTVKVSVGII